jgi:DNA-binding transcriptional regulator/RsmH inhibitor MraZ
MLFSGRYEHTIDSKNRLAIPSPIRDELERGGDGKKLYVARGMQEGTLAVWPEKHFLEMADQLPQTPIPDGIGRQVVITGVRDHIAVWNRDDFARFQQENKARIALLQQRARDAIRGTLERSRTRQ